MATVTPVIGLPSAGLASPVHLLHLNVESGYRVPEIPLYLLWTQLEQLCQRWSLHAASGETHGTGMYVGPLDTSSPGPPISGPWVCPCWPVVTFLPMLDFPCISSIDSMMVTRSSAYRFSQGNPVPNSWERASSAVINSRGLKHEPCWSPILTMNSSSSLQLL